MGEEINMRLENKVALITGAASGIPGELMGFGGACAWRFIEEGAKVMLSDIDGESGRKTLEEFKKLEKDAEFSYLDVTKESNWIEVIDKTITEYGKIDI